MNNKHTPGPWTAKAMNEQTMKREFKKGDPVLVRNNDLQDWQVKEFKRVNLAHPLYPFVDTDDGAWSQCRHIDDFRTGDKVQVRCDDDEDWMDAVYIGYINVDECQLKHGVTTKWYNATQMRDCRWHPSIPWVKKDELTLEQRVEALERKLNKQ